MSERLRLLALAAATYWLVGSTPSAIAADPTLESADPAQVKSLPEIIRDVHEQARNAPGRTGILAEEKKYSLFDEELIIRDFFQDREGVEKIDLLAMDIEGHELEALKGFDLARFRPELIVVEGPTKETFFYLHQRGYENIERYIPFDSVNRYFRRKPPLQFRR